MNQQKELLVQYAHARIQWLMALAKNTWSFSISLAGSSFLAGYWLGQDDLFAAAVQCFMVLFFGFILFKTVRGLKNDRDAGDDELFIEMCEYIHKEGRSDDESDRR